MPDRSAPPHSAEVTEDVVRLGYRLILGRAPESDAVVHEKARSLRTIAELRHDLISSQEFTSRHLAVPTLCLSGLEPRLEIDSLETLDDATLERLFDRVTRTWSALGEQEPFWSVWTDERFRGRELGDNLGEFLESGKVHLEHLLRALERNDVDPRRLHTCLELGCGVGRFTAWLARRFRLVHALDVSPGHLRVAETILRGAGVDNVHLHPVTTPHELRSLPTADLVYSLVVLQHNPPPLIEWMLHGMLSALAPEGVAYFQLPTYLSGYAFDVGTYLRSEFLPGELEMHALPQSRVFEIIEDNGGRVLEVLEDAWTIPELGTRSNTFVVTRKR